MKLACLAFSPIIYFVWEKPLDSSDIQREFCHLRDEAQTRHHGEAAASLANF